MSTAMELTLPDDVDLEPRCKYMARVPLIGPDGEKMPARCIRREGHGGEPGHVLRTARDWKEYEEEYVALGLPPVTSGRRRR